MKSSKLPITYEVAYRSRKILHAFLGYLQFIFTIHIVHTTINHLYKKAEFEVDWHKYAYGVRIPHSRVGESTWPSWRLKFDPRLELCGET